MADDHGYKHARGGSEGVQKLAQAKLAELLAQDPNLDIPNAKKEIMEKINEEFGKRARKIFEEEDNKAKSQ